MRSCWCIAKMVLRAAVWKTTPQPGSPGFPTVIVWVAAALAAGLAFEYVEAGEGAHFVPYGLNAFVAFMAVFLTVAAFFVRPAGRTTFLAALLALTVFMTLIGTAFEFARAHVTSGWQHLAWWGYPAAITLFLLHLAWWIGTVLAIQRSVEPERRRGRVLRTAGLWLAVMVIYVALPHEPMFRGRDFDLRTANYWEFIPAVLNGSFHEGHQPPPRRVNAAKVELAQAALLDEAASRLAPQVKGRTDIYAIGLAGWSDQDVFVKELKGGLNALSQILPLDGHVIQLINHPDTVASTPIASRQNFAAAVRAVARVMDRDEDILMLFMTSHGSPNGVALRLPGELYRA